MTTWRQQNGVMTYAVGNAVATIKPYGVRYWLTVTRNGILIVDTSQRSLGAAQTMGEWAVWNGEKKK
jgi:hypothetical protein